ncbi:hypothetical protein SAQ01S_26480 [Sphingomonas aquatilis NBRC 16722]|nr:hypothetical protein SAQ01S_26480 [Sphingomonas aquatilis NBRC 16722]
MGQASGLGLCRTIAGRVARGCGFLYRLLIGNFRIIDRRRNGIIRPGQTARLVVRPGCAIGIMEGRERRDREEG